MKDELLVDFVFILVIAQLFGYERSHQENISKIRMVKRSEASFLLAILSILPQLTFQRRLKLEPTPKPFFKHLHIDNMPIDELEFVEVDQIKVDVESFEQREHCNTRLVIHWLELIYAEEISIFSLLQDLVLLFNILSLGKYSVRE